MTPRPRTTRQSTRCLLESDTARPRFKPSRLRPRTQPGASPQPVQESRIRSGSLWFLAVAVCLLLFPATATAVMPDPDPDPSPELRTGPQIPSDSVAPPDGPAGASQKSAPGDRELEFECPEPTDGSGSWVIPGLNVVYGCPIRIYDGTPAGGGFPFGNIQIAVHGEDPALAAFFSLHGNPASDGRTEYARSGMTHTTFTTSTRGLSWGDQWTDNGYPSNEALGEWASGTMDDQARLYVAYLWNEPTTQEEYRSLVGVVKAPTPTDWQQTSNRMTPYEEAFFLQARSEDQVITETYLSHVPGEQNMSSSDSGNNTPGPTTDESSDEAIVLAWHEEARDGQTGTRNLTGWIDVAWTHTGSGNNESDWTFLEEDELIGPCRGMSDTVTWERQVYVACIVDEGYDARTRSQTGDVDVWRFDPETKETRLVSHTGIQAVDHVRLTSTPDGYFAVAGSQVSGEQTVRVQVSLGWHAEHWNLQAADIGLALHRALGERPLQDAHVTALALTEDDKTLFLVYKEWNDVERPEIDPDAPIPRLGDFKKVVVSMNECEYPIAGAEFHLGEIWGQYQLDAWNTNPGVYNDRQDGLQTIRLPDQRERVFFAINDYGSAQFASIVPSSGVGDTVCAVAGPPLPPPAAAIPQSVAMGSGYNMAVGSSLGLVALSMVGYLLTVRRKNPLSVATKAR